MHFITNRVLRRRLILEEYITDIEYIKVENIVADSLSRFPLNGNQETTQNSTLSKENSVRNKLHQRHS